VPDEEQEALALILTGVLQGLRPDLPPDYLNKWALELVMALTEGEGLNYQDAVRVGSTISMMADPPERGDTVH
jgi:hypothetical protein